MLIQTQDVKSVLIGDQLAFRVWNRVWHQVADATETPVYDHVAIHINQAVRRQLKNHFDTIRPCIEEDVC